ncbi:hypothetical protein [Oscillatoria acuminata]|nr:hypothetical protein [Oscillatoria acuminata]
MGIWPLFLTVALPVFAQLTPAGTPIENRATGSFEDPQNPGIPIEVQSNTVTITVAEVAGITVQATGITDADGDDRIDVGDLLYFQYQVTNVGNDPTRFRIPNSANITGPGTLAGNVEISTDGGQTWIQVTGTELITESVPVNGSIQVRVPVTVRSDAVVGSEIFVQLGNTPEDEQNVERVASNLDVYTVDNPDGSVDGEVAGPPVNGTREASATQQTTVAAVPLALAALYKTHGTPIEVNNPADPSDDVITYQLALDVRSQLPPGVTGFVPGDLAPNERFPINVDGNLVNRILISDAMPVGTQFVLDSAVAPQGWQVVFTADDPNSANALQANWRTDVAAIGGVANVRRVGFISEATIAQGTQVSGFEFKVVTSNIAPGTTAIANIAQVFGGTAGNPDRLVYDESGDQNPSNFNDDGTLPVLDADGNPVVSSGVANPATDGVDPNNSNTGVGPGGEANVVTLPFAPTTIQNGPTGSPGAVGPTDNNNDFSNVVVPVPPNVPPGQAIAPPPANFGNTVVNPTGQAITIAPVNPSDRDSLPAGTTVTITYGGRTVTYVYDPITGFTTSDPPIVIPGEVSPADYQVQIQLPNAQPNTAYEIPIAAFIDTDGNGRFDEGEQGNITINRIYTGFIETTKESRILKGTGPDVLPGQETFSTEVKTPSPGNIIEYRLTYNNFSTVGGPGNLTLTARNLVITEDGTTYDPVTNPAGNNWALDTDNLDEDSNPTTGIDTSHVVGSAVDSTGGEIQFFQGRPATTPTGEQSGTTVETDVTRYVIRVTQEIAPGESGTFTFRRRVN